MPLQMFSLVGIAISVMSLIFVVFLAVRRLVVGRDVGLHAAVGLEGGRDLTSYGVEGGGPLVLRERRGPGDAGDAVGDGLGRPSRRDGAAWPAGPGERNNGINIGAAAGAPVSAAAGGRVAYVGDDIVGQGLTVLIIHRDGWRTVYGHLGSATVDDGADVRA
eukprot:gene21839-26775_t